MLQSEHLHLEGFSELWVEKVEAGRCLAWALEGARGCALSLEWGVEGEGGLLLAPGPKPGQLEGQFCV